MLITLFRSGPSLSGGSIAASVWLCVYRPDNIEGWRFADAPTERQIAKSPIEPGFTGNSTPASFPKNGVSGKQRRLAYYSAEVCGKLDVRDACVMGRVAYDSAEASDGVTWGSALYTVSCASSFIATTG